jgi:hypothetical protein
MRSIKFWISSSASSHHAGEQSLAGILLDSSRVLCRVPPLPNATTLGIALSLNNASSGTLSQDILPWRVYESPAVSRSRQATRS